MKLLQMNPFKQLLNNKKSLYLTLCISVLYILPLLLIDYQYLDDTGRYLLGYGWSHDGRFLATFLAKIWSMNNTILGIYPYSSILGGLILGFTGYVVSHLFVLEQDKLLKWSSLLLLTAPPLLGNIVFKFDILPMAFSILVVVLPYLFFQEKKKFVIVGILGCFVSLGLYQSATTIFLMIASYFLIQDLKEAQWKCFLVNLGIVIGAFVIASLLYFFTINLFEFPIASRGKMIFSDENFIEGLYQNYLIFAERLDLLYNSSNYRFLFNIFLIICALSFVLQSFNTNVAMNQLRLIPIILLILCVNYILISGVNILLTESYTDLRLFNGFGIFLLLLMSFQSRLKGVYSQIGRASAALLVMFSFVMISQFATVLSNQTKFQEAISQEFTPYFRGEPIQKVAFRATLSIAPRNKLMYKEFPMFQNVLSSPVGEYSFWTKNMLNANGMLETVEITNIEGDVCNFELLKQTDLYSIRKVDATTLLIDFSLIPCN